MWQINFFKTINGEFFMRKAFLMIMLFLIVCVTVNAQYKVVKQVIGSGGFVFKTSGQYKVSGIWGQSFVGVKPAMNSNKTYHGFWTPGWFVSINGNDLTTSRSIFNYPNPVTNATNFKFELAESSFVTLSIYNSIGSLVTIVANNQFLPAGENFIEWDINISNNSNDELVSGSYLYELSVVPAFASAAKNSYTLRNSMLISK
jgi:hypothetical protein